MEAAVREKLPPLRRMLIVAQKEFSDIITSKRLWILIGILVLFYVAATASVRLGGVSHLLSITQAFSSTTSSVNFIAPLLGIAFGYDAISRERESGTLRILLSRPVYREDVINGKVLSSLAIMSIALFTSTFLTVSITIFLYGLPVSLDDFARLTLFSISSVIFAFSYYSISLFFSTISKKSSHSLLFCIVIWLLFTLILPIIASLLAVFLTPYPPISSNLSGGELTEYMQEYTKRFMEKYYEINSIINAPSITYHYSTIVNYILPQYTSEGTPMDITRMFPTYYISVAVLILYPAVFIILSYMMFTRREEK